MTDFLKQNGIDVRVKFIWHGSMKWTWRLYNPKTQWDMNLGNRLEALGFRDFDGKSFNQFSGNGGAFSVFVRGHLEFIKGIIPPTN